MVKESATEAPGARGTLYRVAAVVAVVVALVLAGFAAFRLARSGRVLGNVAALGVELGGLTLDEAVATLAEREQQLVAANVPVSIEGEKVTLDPMAVGFRVDEVAGGAKALTIGREGSIPDQFRWWLSKLFSDQSIKVPASLDDRALEQVLSAWDDEVVARPPFEGDVAVEDGELLAMAPATGLQIDRTKAARVLLEAALVLPRQEASLEVVAVTPHLTIGDVEKALAQAKLLLSGPVVLRADELEVAFSVEDLEAAFVAEVVEESSPSLDLGFDPEVVEELLAPERAGLEAPPVDARFEIEGTQVNLVPGQKGTELDAAETAKALLQAAATASRTGRLPFVEGADPEVTTAELAALHIEHLVSAFTTYHDCCQPRVTNIHLLADQLDGTIVKPGETFSINETAGERTEAQGYVLAPTILFGEIKDTVGGGVSQFATTFYNAVFWGGYEDVLHSPHSYYFSRYPEGIEATISWPLPDLVFRNNTQSAILIDTDYTGSSITVRFYSNNDGRIVVGEQSGGRTRITAVAEGGGQTRRVEASVSERFDPKEPTIEYRANPLLGVDDQNELQTPGPGWSVRVNRTITIEDEEPMVDTWIVRYRPRNQILEVHPCKMPETTEVCPTTTLPGETTTTLPGETTTTPTG